MCLLKFHSVSPLSACAARVCDPGRSPGRGPSFTRAEMCCESLLCKCTNHLAAVQRRWGVFGGSCYSLATSFQHGTGNPNCTGTFTSHSPMASWFLSCISQSSWTLSAQWWMVRITGLVSRAPGGPQLTTGLSSVWPSSTGGLDKTENSRFQPQRG